MPLLTKPSSAPRTALFYITVGALLAVWSSTWYMIYPPERPISKFFCVGMFMSGVVLLIIGFAVGQIGRAARNAELPPREAIASVARTEQNAASRPVPAAGQAPGVNPAVVAPPGHPD